MEQVLPRLIARFRPFDPFGLLLHAAQRLAVWRRHARTRRQIAALSERALADVGISRAAREQELSKPFWR